MHQCCRRNERPRTVDVKVDPCGVRRVVGGAVVRSGRVEAVVRPPLVKIDTAEIGRIKQALTDAGLLDGRKRDAA